MQQIAPKGHIKNIIEQTNPFRLVKKVGTVCNYKRSRQTVYIELSILGALDLRSANDEVQLCYIAGLIIGDLANGSIFHIISDFSRKSRPSISTVVAARVIAACEAIYEGNLIAHANSILLGNKIELIIALQSKYLLQELLIQPKKKV